MNAHQVIVDTARTLVASDKGLLAMDESNPTCNKRFATVDATRSSLGSRKPTNGIIKRLASKLSEP
jgi:fructose-bisphosphate aldolase class 1